ncbi:MAG: hypothetical protein F6K56_03070 [Moorea sp. SIO3G5]|nr:hypothetical protein [Moorena sp. SIO3G5]
MKSILKIFSSLLLTFALFLGVTGEANASSHSICDLVNNYSCPPEMLDVYDLLIIDVPAGNHKLELDIMPFNSLSKYDFRYEFGGDLEDVNTKEDYHTKIVTDEKDYGFVQNLTENNPQSILVTVGKIY